MSGSPVDRLSNTSRPWAGCSPTVLGFRTKVLDQLGSGSTCVRTARPNPCSLFPITPTKTEPMFAMSMPRVRRMFFSLSSWPTVVTPFSKLADATRAALTAAPERLGMRSPSVRFAVG